MGEFSENLWAPWRMAYIRDLPQDGAPGGPPGACFVCHYASHPQDDEQNLVLWRSARTLTFLNRYPYSSGHLLIAPIEHQSDMAALSAEVLCELTTRIRDAQRALREAVRAQGFNIGANLGRCAGAGLPDHLHWHLVPRWAGDTNFMTALGGVRVMPEGLSEVFTRLRSCAAAAKLPD